MIELENIKKEEVIKIAKEFNEETQDNNSFTIPRIQAILEKSFEGNKVASLMQSISLSKSSCWNCLADISNQKLVDLLKNEHPQTTAFILIQLPSSKAAIILTMLKENYAFEVINRILKIEKDIDRGTIKKIEKNINKIQALITKYLYSTKI